MTRVFVQRSSAAGSSSSTNNTNRSSLGPPQPQVVEAEQEPQEQVLCEDLPLENVETGKDEDLDVPISDKNEDETVVGSEGDVLRRVSALRVIDEGEEENDAIKNDDYALQVIRGSSYPPPPPAPPPKPSSNFNSKKSVPLRIGSSRRANVWPVVSTRTSPTGSRPSSPRSHGENEGYNSADEQSPRYGSSYDNTERERQFEIDIRRVQGFEVKKMLEDGNCLFRAVADQVYGDSEAYDLVRQMCIDYMVYGNNVEIQALSEMYNRPIHIYSYSSEPINIFHGSYNTDTPPIQLSYHHGNHYNSLVDPRRLTIGAGLGFSSLQGRNVDKDQVKAAIKAQQDQQIDNALLAEARFYSDVELTEKEIECMVMEASRAEYIANDRFKQQLGPRESSSSDAEPSSSGAKQGVADKSMQMVLSMGFSYMQAIEAYSIFGDDVDSMVCYLLETSSRRKGKATTE
ncbi:Ovarian tumor, otubain [Cynara cardunculus var. scolymus]|uniref:ubiquitinyl hydrolase 1 n=1 Tax=Cynara cardunculus var. scolymus TaxID=59895 RepID=A0A118K519_CYNCS|nr:Ovarian tumor, otubain [Cynara cardunculus var. scolymus]